jgi:hypothetical protein
VRLAGVQEYVDQQKRQRRHGERAYQHDYAC